MRIVQSDGTAGSPAPSALLSFSPKLSKSRSVFAPLSKSSFYFSLNSSKKEKKKRKEKEQTLPSFSHRPCLHFLPKAGPVGATPMLPPDPGNQVTDRPGAEKGPGEGERGKGERERPPSSALPGAQGAPPVLCPAWDPQRPGHGCRSLLDFPGCQTLPGARPAAAVPASPGGPWQASLDPGHFSLFEELGSWRRAAGRA